MAEVPQCSAVLSPPSKQSGLTQKNIHLADKAIHRYNACLYANYAQRAQTTMSDSLKVLLQYLLPKQAITAVAGKLAHARAGGMTTSVIGWFVQRYQVNMAEAANPDIASYPTFNEFFTRPLREGARPLAAAKLICPVDGAISQFGNIERDQIFQAKGHQFS
ncbi:MAG: hypothetical protein RL748_1915, partial [Pseudomonadota bacterium]